MTDANTLTEKAEHLDTIETCETYLADYAAHVEAGGSTANFLFNVTAADFAAAQIAFERDAIAKLEA
jgi:hypothetical protein